MLFEKMDSVLLIQLCLFACGLGWVVTGSKIGKVVRVLGYVCTGWIPGKPLTSVFFCPPCCTWWMGAGLSLWAGLPWHSILQIAFTSSFIMAIFNSQWQLDADDRELIEGMLWTGGRSAVSQTPSQPEEHDD